jgi:glutaminyl-tRNA synthetase
VSDGESRNFIREIIEEDLRTGLHTQVVTRFPPEPNGYLHIGHAKAICINHSMAARYGGRFHLRFDDTNPEKESDEYVRAIQHDIRWLGMEWDGLYFASDVFDTMVELAEGLILKGLAYVDLQPVDEMRAKRGTVSEAGVRHPDADLPPEHHLRLFRAMRAGEFADGTAVLRGRVDMTAANMKMRDPLLFRVRHVPHHRAGDAWCIYPMYDYAHPLEDALEGVTHSLCTLEFENNRDIYDWVIDNTAVTTAPKQYEFARLSMTYTVLSKRFLLGLVERELVDGWSDPRMPTLSGFRRRGVRPEALRAFVDKIGVAKANSTVDLEVLDGTIRDDLNTVAPRVMAVLDPLEVVITNLPEGQVEWLDARYWPHDVPNEGTRRVPFTRQLFIERGDFAVDPPRKWRRLSPGAEVRLRYGFFIRCERVVTDESGHVVRLECTYDPATRGGGSPDGRKVQGTLHWVSASHGLPAEIRVFDRLFKVERPGADGDLFDDLNPASLRVHRGVIEPSVADDPADRRYQFERQGYFWRDPTDGRGDDLVFNRIVGLKDSWARKKPAPAPKPKAPKKQAKKAPAKRPELTADQAVVAAALIERGVGAKDADTLATNPELIGWLDAAEGAGASLKGATSWVVNALRAALKDGPVSLDGAGLGALIGLQERGDISSKAAKQVFARMAAEGGDAASWVDSLGLAKLSDPVAIGALVDQVMAAHPAKVAEYQGGRTGLMGFFVGQVLKASGGRADPGVVNRLVRQKLS